MNQKIWGALLSLHLAACAGLGGGIVYDFEPDTSVKSSDQSGEISNVKIESRHFIFQFKNKSKSLSKIIWDESTLVDASGNPHKLLPDGSKYIDAGRSIPPAMIPAGGQLQTSVAYADGVQMVGDVWIEDLLVPCMESGQICKPEQYYGKNLTLILTVENDGKKREYQTKILLKPKGKTK